MMKNSMETKKCEGGCEQHVGEVITVKTYGDKNSVWNGTEFDYCETAIQEDRERGFQIEIPVFIHKK